eukprot:2228700-Pleurochrysis_carterae.AAC.1
MLGEVSYQSVSKKNVASKKTKSEIRGFAVVRILGVDCFVPFERLGCKSSEKLLSPPTLAESVAACALPGSNRKPSTVHGSLSMEATMLAQAQVAEVTRQEYIKAVGVEAACFDGNAVSDGEAATRRSGRQSAAAVADVSA